jgi:hypothetical protein
MTAKRRSRLVLSAALIPAVFLLASSIGGMAWFHYADPADSCVSCHEMTGMHAAWASSSHRTLHCRNCHGGSLTLDAHALGAHLNRVVQHFTRSPDKPIRLTEDALLPFRNPAAPATRKVSPTGRTAVTRPPMSASFSMKHITRPSNWQPTACAATECFSRAISRIL